MLVTAWLMSRGQSHAWTFYPMIFMFVTTIAALIYHLLQPAQEGLCRCTQGEALWGNT